MRIVQGAVVIIGLMLALMMPRVSAFSAQPPSPYEKLEDEGKIEEQRRLMEKRSERELSEEEKKKIARLLATANDPNEDWAQRVFAIKKLGAIGHVSLVSELKSLAWLPIPEKKPWYMNINRAAVKALSRTPNRQVIPILIELMSHPIKEVRRDAWWKLGMLIGFVFQDGRPMLSCLEPKCPVCPLLGGTDGVLMREDWEKRAKEIVANWKKWWEYHGKTYPVRWELAWVSH